MQETKHLSISNARGGSSQQREPSSVSAVDDRPSDPTATSIADLGDMMVERELDEKLLPTIGGESGHLDFKRMSVRKRNYSRDYSETKMGDQNFEDAQVECPNYVADIDRWLNKPNGSPTVFFILNMVLTVIFGLFFMFGTVATDSVYLAFKVGDSLLVAGNLTFAMSAIVLIPLRLEQLRKICRSRAPGDAMVLLGVTHPDNTGFGEKLISAEDAKKLKKFYTANHPQFNLILTKPWLFVYQLINTSWVWIFCVGMGYGVHKHAWHNRVSGVVLVVWLYTVQPLMQADNMVLINAMTLVKACVRRISTPLKLAIFSENGPELSEEQWQRTIANPCRDLIEQMELLTTTFGTATGVTALVSFNLAIGSLCIVLSPSSATVGERMGAPFLDEYQIWRTLVGIMVAAFLWIMCMSIYGPAALSSQCDDLRDTLNDARISDLSDEMHKRVIILEKAMSNVNHGQGIGFKIGGTVVDKRMLMKIATKVGVTMSTALPVILALSTPRATARPQSNDVEHCTLSAIQTSSLQLTADLLDNSSVQCAYNVSEITNILGV